MAHPVCRRVSTSEIGNAAASRPAISVQTLEHRDSVLCCCRPISETWIDVRVCVCVCVCNIGHFLLTNLLLTDLKNTAADGGDVRVVVVTSSLHDASAKSCRSASLQDTQSVQSCCLSNCLCIMHDMFTDRPIFTIAHKCKCGKPLSCQDEDQNLPRIIHTHNPRICHPNPHTLHISTLFGCQIWSIQFPIKTTHKLGSRSPDYTLLSRVQNLAGAGHVYRQTYIFYRPYVQVR